MSSEVVIWALSLEFGSLGHNLGHNLGLKARIWVLRLKFKSQSTELAFMAGSWDLSFAVELNAEGWHGQQASKDPMT